jgi:hypothetical protein
MNSQPHSILMMTQDLQLMNILPQPHPPPNKTPGAFLFLFLFQFSDIKFLVNFPPKK